MLLPPEGAKAERDWLKNIRDSGRGCTARGRSAGRSPLPVQLPERYPLSAGCQIIEVREVQDKTEKRFVKRYALTDNKVQLESLRRRLFKFL